MKQIETKSKASLTPTKPVRVDSPRTHARLTLRMWQERDREAFLALVGRSRAHLDRWAPMHNPGETDEQLFDRQLRLAMEGDATGSAARRLTVLDNGSIVGGFNLNQICRGLTFEADANWWVDAAHCRRGFGSQGVNLMLGYGLGDLPEGLGLHRITCGIVAGNTPSERIAVSQGFVKQVGVTSHLQVGGRWIRHDVYVASPDSFANRSAA